MGYGVIVRKILAVGSSGAKKPEAEQSSTIMGKPSLIFVFI
jgi:hypothetical protein